MLFTTSYAGPLKRALPHFESFVRVRYESTAISCLLQTSTKDGVNLRHCLFSQIQQLRPAMVPIFSGESLNTNLFREASPSIIPECRQFFALYEKRLYG